VKIEIINTGSELMLGYVLNTHQQWLCQQLSQKGHLVQRQTAIDDTAEAIQSAVREAIPRADLIVVTGGLGPTSDDRTRDLVARLLGVPLREDPEVLRRIEAFFVRRKRPVPVSTRVQALVPEGATVLQNEHGTAPGLVMEYDRPSGQGMLVMLPGPPRELRPMFVNQVLPLIEQRFGAMPDFFCAVLRTVGIGESFLEENRWRIGSVDHTWPRCRVLCASWRSRSAVCCPLCGSRSIGPGSRSCGAKTSAHLYLRA
jgi:nicotinamide-nucleotide amidase